MPETFAEFVKPEKCQHAGCNKPAKWTLQIRMWAKGYPKTSTPLSMQLSAKVCDEHQWHPKPEEFWVKETKDRISAALNALGRAEPDFSTAEFMWVPLGVIIK
jgi:hypothetical protein